MNATAVQGPTFTIAALAEKTGVSAQTLRYCECIGLLAGGPSTEVDRLALLESQRRAVWAR